MSYEHPKPSNDPSDQSAEQSRTPSASSNITKVRPRTGAVKAKRKIDMRLVAAAVVILIIGVWLFNSRSSVDSDTKIEKKSIATYLVTPGETITRDKSDTFKFGDIIQFGFKHDEIQDGFVFVRVTGSDGEQDFETKNIRLASEGDEAFISVGRLQPDSYKAEIFNGLDDTQIDSVDFTINE